MNEIVTVTEFTVAQPWQSPRLFDNCFQIKLKFRNTSLFRGRYVEESRKIPLRKDKSQQQTQPKYDDDLGLKSILYCLKGGKTSKHSPFLIGIFNDFIITQDQTWHVPISITWSIRCSVFIVISSTDRFLSNCQPPVQSKSTSSLHRRWHVYLQSTKETEK